MKKRFFVTILVIVGIFILGYAAFGLPAFLAGRGTLEGKVNIGPICPVEGIGMNCSPSPETYQAQNLVIVRTWWPHAIVAKIHPDGTGYYRTSLAAGEYILQVATAPMYSQSYLISIQDNKTTVQDISIDTGIR